MKYFIVDTCSDYKDKLDYKGLKKLLIECIGNDALSNCGEYEILKDCYADLSKMAEEDFTSENWIIKKLENYGYVVINLLELERNLEDLKTYWLDKNKAVDNICEVIDKVNEELNNE